MNDKTLNQLERYICLFKINPKYKHQAYFNIIVWIRTNLIREYMEILYIALNYCVKRKRTAEKLMKIRCC